MEGQRAGADAAAALDHLFETLRCDTRGRRRFVRGRPARGLGLLGPNGSGKTYDTARIVRLSATRAPGRRKPVATIWCGTDGLRADASVMCPRTLRSTGTCGSASFSDSWADCAASRVKGCTTRLGVRARAAGARRGIFDHHRTALPRLPPARGDRPGHPARARTPGARRADQWFGIRGRSSHCGG